MSQLKTSESTTVIFKKKTHSALWPGSTRPLRPLPPALNSASHLGLWRILPERALHLSLYSGTQHGDWHMEGTP